MNTSIVIRVVTVLAIAGGLYANLPPRGLPPPERPTQPGGEVTAPIRGAIHVHTRRSDGTGTVDEVAAAAQRAGLQFVIITDHGDATRRPDPPEYRHGVLTIDAVEISTSGGHVVAIGLPQAPYRLGGEPRDVVDDIVRLGGFAIAAHPGSAKTELQWTDWDANIDGLEWLNMDSEWRDERRWSLARALLAYGFRGPEALASILDRPVSVLARWDMLLASRRVIGLAALDAHARIGLDNAGAASRAGATLRIPSYESLFRTLSIAVSGVALSGEAAPDAGSLLSAIRSGHLFSSIDALAAGGWLTFTAESGVEKAAAGDALALTGPVTLTAEAVAPPGAIGRGPKNGVVVQSGPLPLRMTAPPEPAVYRIEVTLPKAPGAPAVPWIVSNPIYVGRSAPTAAVATPPAITRAETIVGDAQTSSARVEQSGSSMGAVNVIAAVPGTQLLFRYGIGGRLSESPYAALVLPAPATIASFEHLVFDGRANHPMRLSVQLRAPNGDRWERTVYLDDAPRTVDVSFADMTGRGEARGRPPALSSVDSILFVVDGVHTPVGANGQIWLDNVKVGR